MENLDLLLKARSPERRRQKCFYCGVEWDRKTYFERRLFRTCAYCRIEIEKNIIDREHVNQLVKIVKPQVKKRHRYDKKYNAKRAARAREANRA